MGTFTWARKRATRKFVGLLLVAVLTATLGLTFTGTAAAAGTLLFDQTFANATASGTGAVELPAPSTATPNAACLTFTGNSTAGPLLSCPVSAGYVNNPPGSGALSVTPLLINKVGGVFAATSVPTSKGLDVTFTLYQYGGGGTPADGIAFALAAVNPASPTAPPAIGQSGGALGYSASASVNGLANGYLGFGFDVFGNFSNKTYQGTDCGPSTFVKTGDKVPGQLLIRGPGFNKLGYCALNGTAPTNTSSLAQYVYPTAVPMHSTSRSNSGVPVEIVINSNSAPIVTAGGMSVNAESYKVVFTPVGVGALPVTLTGLLPAMAASMVGAPSWLDAQGLPKQLAFGWVGSTGSLIDNHEISNIKVSSIDAVAQLTASQASFTPAAATPTTPLAVGSPVSLVVTPGVALGAAETGSISVSETVPAGVKPLGASGTGWVCGLPAGQLITCTNSNGPFIAGGTLPTVTVTAVVTGAGVSQSTVQSSSVVTASSDTGQAAYSTSSPAGPNPTAPTISTISPSSAPAAGGGLVTISGTNLTGATSIQIGTTAELSAGTGITLLTCTGGVPAPGCFTVSGSDLAISSLPGHAGGAVDVKVVNLGVSATGTYTYLAVPGTPVVSAVAGVLSATANWTVPDNGGSSITGYTVTPFLNGTAQSGLVQNLGAAATSFTFSSLTAGSPYKFTVVAVNAIGSGAAGTSLQVTPYTTPGPPFTPTAVASSGQAVVSWVAPFNNGSSPITGYVVTPYVGASPGTAQTFNSPLLTQTVTGLTPGTSYTFTVKAINVVGTGTESAKTTPAVKINALPTLVLSTPVAGEVGAAYSIPAFVPTGGTGPFTWTVESGSLPTGIVLSSAGALTGLPTADGIANFTVKVTDSAGKSASAALTLTVAPAPVLSNGSPPAGQVGVSYADALGVQAGTGTGPFIWSISAGGLPAGVTLNTSTGLLLGIPTTAGSYPFTVSVIDAKSQTATQALTITVTASPTLSFPAPPGGQVQVPYSDQLVVTGGTGPYSWSSTGPLPIGVSLNVLTGLLSGTPTVAGSYPLIIGVEDSRGQGASQPVTLTIAAPPALTFTPPAGEVGVAYTAQPVRTGGTGPFTYSIQLGTLPAGLTLNAGTGTISGTPTAAETSAVTIRVVDGFGQSATAVGTVIVVAAPSLALPVPQTGDVGVAYLDQLTVTGGTGPFAWSILSGALPTGLNLGGGTGLISGTPSAGGTFSFTVQVTDGFGRSATQALSIGIRSLATVVLQAAPVSISPGGSVALTATVGPVGATGIVTFTDTISSGPNIGAIAILAATSVTGDGTAQVTVTLSAFGAHTIVAAYGGDPSHGTAASTLQTVQVIATAGSLIVGEFRLSGPAGPADQYVELANVSPNPLALAGFQLSSSSGVVTTLPGNSPVLPAGRSFLIGGTGYSLGANVDYAASTGLGSGGIAVLAPDTAKTATDAVGPGIAGFSLGLPLPPLVGSPTDQYAWVRTQQTSFLKNTQNNATDFALVSTSGGIVGGLQSMLGSPSPTGLADPWQHTFVLSSTLADPGVSANAAPNRVAIGVRPGVPGNLQVRRWITNTTAGTVTTLRVRLHSLSEANGLPYVSGLPVGTVTATLRAVNPATPTTEVTVSSVPMAVQNLSIDAPATAVPGGGLNTTYTVDLPPDGLGQGQSVLVGFTFAADTGGTFWFGYDVDTLGLG